MAVDNGFATNTKQKPATSPSNAPQKKRAMYPEWLWRLFNHPGIVALEGIRAASASKPLRRSLRSILGN